MKTKGISYQRTNAIAKDIEAGLSNKEACFVNDVSQRSFYEWLTIAESAEDKAEPTAHEKKCLHFLHTIKRVRIIRKQKRIQQLEKMPSPVGLIFLLRNEFPQEFNKQPYLIPNFEKLEHYMQAEYTQAEIETVREAISAAEQRRQSEIEYDEDDTFTTNDQQGDIQKVELG